MTVWFLLLLLVSAGVLAWLVNRAPLITDAFKAIIAWVILAVVVLVVLNELGILHLDAADHALAESASMIPVLRFATSARISRAPTPAGMRIFGVLDALAQTLGHDLTITCGDDSHGPQDPHTLGRAYDVRTKDLTADQLRTVYQGLTTILGASFLVLYEGPPGTPSRHPDVSVTINAGATGPHLHCQLRQHLRFPPLA